MDKFRAVWEKVDAALFQILRYICAVILGALVAVVFYIFFGRYVLHNSPMWGEPFSLLCLVWLSLLGSVLVVRKNEHLAVTMFDEKLGKTGVFLTDILSTVCEPWCCRFLRDVRRSRLCSNGLYDDVCFCSGPDQSGCCGPYRPHELPGAVQRGRHGAC